MSFSRTALVFFALTPFVFGASKDMQELQRDVAMLQDQVRTLQRALDERFVTMQTLVQQTLESVNRTNTAVAVMQSRFSDAVKLQQDSITVPVNNVGQKLDQMAEDFRAVRESVLDMNTRMGKLDAKMADLQNLINTTRAPAPPPPALTPNGPSGTDQTQQAQTLSPPPGMQAETTYTNAYRDYMGAKYDLALQEFTDYLKYYPTTQFAPNAQFYVGEIYFKKQDYPNALQSFDSVLEHFSDNSKTPDAHYMKGMSLLQSGKNDAAAREFRDVYTRYPDTDIAAKAKARLKELGLNVGTPAAPKSRRAR